jgi:DNA-binding transcriptional LysR family regulator
MDLLGALGVLARVVETGSFSAVAREREVSQAAVARQISQLEEHFGVRLFHRTTRKLSLTDDGQMLLGLARPVLDGVEGMEAALGRQRFSPVGLVRIGTPVASIRFLAPRLPALLADYPGLRVELVVSDHFGDMIEDRLDLAIRPGEITDASLVVRRAGTAARVAVAAPRYLERHSAPSDPTDLATHSCLVHDTGPDSDLWTFATPEWHQFSPAGRGVRRFACRRTRPRIEGFSLTGRADQPGLSVATASGATDPSGAGFCGGPGAGASAPAGDGIGLKAPTLCRAPISEQPTRTNAILAQSLSRPSRTTRPLSAPRTRARSAVAYATVNRF